MTRIEKAAAATRLRDNGLTTRQIADVMGVSKSTVSAWFYDPDGSKLRARKAAMRRECPECGGWMSVSEGKDNPKRCLDCEHAEPSNLLWDEQAITNAFHYWIERYDRQPGAWDWNPRGKRNPNTHACDVRAARFERDGCWPNTSTVLRVFGSWNAAVAAAGMDPLPFGRPSADHYGLAMAA